jgi:hypothetical protein
MGFRDWIRRLFGRGRPPAETVPYFDVEVGHVVHIPVSELRPGVVQAHIQGIEGLVWVSPDQLQPGEVRHPPFGEDILAYLRQIQAAFAEHRPLSLEEWEDGFRRDANPEREIALWSHAADVYTAFAAEETAPERRRDVYRVIVTCMTTTPDTVWHVLRLDVLTRPEAERIVNRFYGRPERAD